jgi:hypothetical protein
MDREMEQYPFSITWQEGHVQRLVFVMEFELEVACLRHHDNGGLPDELVGRDVNSGPHHPVLPAVCISKTTVGEKPSHDILVRVIYSGKLVDEVSNPWIELLKTIGSKQSEVSAR